MQEIRTAIVGTKFRGTDAIEALAALAKDDPVTVIAEPDNPHDRLAVAVYREDQHLGYVPKNCNVDIAMALRDGRKISATVYLEAIVHHGEVKAAPKILVSWDDETAEAV